MKNQNCALRALTLCDGQVLEYRDARLRTCLCEFEERQLETESLAAATIAAELRNAYLEIIELEESLESRP